MRNFGIELEFFVRKSQTNEIVPAFEVTSNTDGDPVIGEIKTKVHNNIVDCVFELKKLLYLEREKIATQGHVLCLEPMIKVEKEFLKSLRENQNYIDGKNLEILKAFSIYGDGKTGKLLPREVYKASLQVNMSESRQFSYDTYERISIKDEYDYKRETATRNHSEVFNYIEPIMAMDKKFSNDIVKTTRVKGVYAIKDGEFGKRIEYRSLPNNINLEDLIQVLK